jgi:RsiW-degrading membrane proteinase PrsW (M82 family)
MSSTTTVLICSPCGTQNTADALFCCKCGNSLAQTTSPTSETGSAGSEAHHLDTDPGKAFGMEDGGELGISKTFGLFKSLDYGFLLPFRKILSQGLLKKKAVRWVMFFGLSPIAVFVMARYWELSFVQTIWLFETYFCLFWGLYFHTLIRPRPDVWKRAIGYSLFTAFVGIALVGAQSLPVFRNLYSWTEGNSLLFRILGFVFGVGILEESCKALPLLMFGLHKGRIHGVRDGLFLGFMSGLGFAAAEGIGYSFGATTNLLEADAESVGVVATFQVIQIIFRMISGPLMHAAWAGIVGWFIGLAATRQKPRWPIIVVGITFMAVLHGVNNVVAGTPFHLLVGAISIIILMAYITHGEDSAPAIPTKA